VLAIALGLSRTPYLPVRWWQWFLLGAGISHAGLWLALPLLGWFLLVAYRARIGPNASKSIFNGCQIAIALLTPVMLAALVNAVETGLLGSPDMQVVGNDSTAGSLLWYQDRSTSTLPRAMVVSVPVIAYRLLMLAWSLWLAFTLFNWLRWGWQSFSKGGTWRKIDWRRRWRSRAGPAA
jgi:hypothetical protein